MSATRASKMEPDPRLFVPGLDSLVWPYDRATFVRDYWQKRPLYIEGREDRLANIAELFFGFDLERILGAADLARTIVQPPLAEQRRRSHRDPPPAPTPEVKTMLRLHALGSQLYVAASGVPGVSGWIEQLSADLGRLWSDGRGDIYATRDGGGADTHFDGNDNFTIQLQGRKLWYFTSRPYYDQPLHNSGDPRGVPYDPTYTFDPAVTDPSQLQEVVLAPGDMFYMPRGFLHGTRASEDSLSFNLSLDAQPWADVLLESLRAYLIRDPRMRQPATRDVATARARVDLFKHLAAGLCGDDLLATPQEGASRPPRRVARRNPLSWWTCADPSGDPCVTIEIRTPDRSAAAFEVSRELLELMEKIPGGPEPFAPADLIRAWGQDPDGARDFIDALVDAGLLDWLDPAK
jgi:ribosomal protein L16 Arg81 hydroxylase